MEFRPLHGGQLRQIADHFGIPLFELVDFSANINPDGPPPAVRSCLLEAINNPSIITNYPDLDEVDLKRCIAKYVEIRPENIVIANGFVPLLDAALRSLSIRSCLLPVPAFVEYRRTLERSHTKIVARILEPDSDFSFQGDDLFGKSCDAILLANPQNPSGALSCRDELLRLAEEALKQNVFVLLDEAFIDYCPENSIVQAIDRFPNLVVFRSVTKFFGMAGLRVAYAAASTDLCKQIQQSIGPWSVTSLASRAAGVAVQDAPYAREAIALNKLRRERLQVAIRKLGIHVYPSAANFLLLRLPESIDRQQFWERMIREHHILLRNCANYEGLSDEFLRTAVRTETENERLTATLACEVNQFKM